MSWGWSRGRSAGLQQLRARCGQGVFDGVLDGLVHAAAVAKTHLDFGGVDVDIHLLGRQLERNQQLVISVVSLDLSEPDASTLPWEGIYAGLPEEEVDRLDAAIRRADLSRDAG